MKSIFITLFLILSVELIGQENLNRLSTSPIQLIGYNRLNFEYERSFSNGQYGIVFYYGQTGNASRKIHGQYSNLSEQNTSVKFYTKNFDSSNFWYGGVVSVASGNVYDENGTDKATNIGTLGILVSGGYQFIYKKFYVNTYLSAGYALTNDLFGSAEYVGNISKPTDWLLTYGLKMGLCF